MKLLLIGLNSLGESEGGLDRYVHDCIRYIPKLNVRLSCMALGSKDILTSDGVKIEAFAKRGAPLLMRWYGALRYFRSLLVKEKHDIVVSHFCLYTFPLIPFIKLPFVVHFHGPWADESCFGKKRPASAYIKRFIEKICYRKASALIVLSSSFRDILHTRYGIPLERIHVVPGGTNISHFDIRDSKEQAREKLGLPADRPVIFCVRRLTERMGIENLISAMKEVHRNHPDALLCIAGKGHLQNKLQQQITRDGLSDHIKLLGFVDDDLLPCYYRAATFSVVPTQDLEGFGLIIIESMAAGTPVMGTPVGGIPEILKPLSHNCLFKDTSTQSIVVGINRALADPGYLPDAKTCLQYTKDNFDWEIISRKLLALYQKQL